MPHVRVFVVRVVRKSGLEVLGLVESVKTRRRSTFRTPDSLWQAIVGSTRAKSSPGSARKLVPNDSRQHRSISAGRSTKQGE